MGKGKVTSSVFYCLTKCSVKKGFSEVESLTNQRQFYFAGQDGPPGSDPPKWNKASTISQLSSHSGAKKVGDK